MDNVGLVECLVVRSRVGGLMIAAEANQEFSCIFRVTLYVMVFNYASGSVRCLLVSEYDARGPRYSAMEGGC